MPKRQPSGRTSSKKQVGMLRVIIRREIAKRKRIEKEAINLRKALNAMDKALTNIETEAPPGGGPNVKDVLKLIDDL